MNLFFSLAAPLFFFCAGEKERTYTGSTPAGAVVRTFLGIALTDSVDFIRWKVNLQDGHYSLQCNYGIGQPNTNGFLNGGKWRKLEGSAEKKQNKYRLQNGNNFLQLVAVNNDLLHLADSQNNLLVGNEGWSYTLTNEAPVGKDQLLLSSKQPALNDSVVYYGRTPCLPFAYRNQSPDCYKLKWWIVLYTHPETRQPTNYFLRGTVVNHERKSGTWSIRKGEDGRVMYRLQSATNDVLQLLVPDDNILFFTDQQGKLLPGNADFSFTLNRKQ